MTNPEKRPQTETHTVHNHKHLKEMVLVSLGMSTAITGLCFLAFFQVAPKFERDLFPSSQIIEGLRKESGLLTQKIEGLGNKVVELEKVAQTISSVQGQVNSMQETLGQLVKTIATLEEKLANQTPSVSGQPVAHKSNAPLLKEKWLAMQSLYDKGDVFSHILHDLIPFVSEDKGVLESLHQLTVHANGPVKPLSTLVQELQAVRHAVEQGGAQSSQVEAGHNMGWWPFIVSKIKGVIRITKEEELSSLEKNKDAQKSFLNLLDKTVKDLQALQLQTALAHIKPLAHEHPALLGNWVLEAEKRHALDNAFTAFKIKFESFLVRVS